MRTPEAIREAHRVRKLKECRDPVFWPRYAVRRIKARAAKEGIAFDLTPADLPLPALCPVFKVPFVLGDQNHPNVPSVDRIRPERGYVRGNVMVISRRANLLRQDSMNPTEIRAVADYVEMLWKMHITADAGLFYYGSYE